MSRHTDSATTKTTLQNVCLECCQPKSISGRLPIPTHIWVCLGEALIWLIFSEIGKMEEAMYCLQNIGNVLIIFTALKRLNNAINL